MLSELLVQRIIPLLAFINLLLIAIFFCLSWKEIRGSFSLVSRRSWMVLLIFFAIALIVRVFVAPHYHHNLIDEPFYIGAAKNMVQNQRAVLDDAPYAKSIGWPALLSVPFFLFGASNYTAIYLSVILGSLSVVLIFLLVCSLSGKEGWALMSALLLALFPLHASYSASAESISASVFFLLAALLCFRVFSEKNRINAGMLAVFLFSFAVQIRVENMLLIPAIFLISKPRRLLVPLLAALPFFLSYIVQFAGLIAFYHDAYSGRIAFFGIPSVAKLSFITPMHIAILFLAFAGAALMLRQCRRILAFFLFWFAVLFIYFMLYNYAVDFHMITSFVALLPLAAYPLDWLRGSSKRQSARLALICCALLLLFALSFKNTASAEELLEARLISIVGSDIPKNCWVVAYVPTVLTSVGSVRAIPLLDFVSSPELHRGRCLFFFEDAYCFKDLLPNSVERCALMRAEHNLTLVREYHGSGAGFSLYSLGAW